jgi:small GTP-binding protein
MGATYSKPSKKEFATKVKMLLMGRPGVGKTSLLSKYKDSIFSPGYEPSTGCNLVSLNVPYHSTSYPMLVMDSLADNDLNLACRLKSIQNTEILAIVFDLSNLETFEDVKAKLKLVKDNYYGHSHVLLVGNKNDLDRQVETEMINELIRAYNDFEIEYLEVSAKSGHNVSEFFQKALELGYYSSKVRWDKIKVLLYAYKFSVPGENLQFSWGNICEALPNLIKKKKKNVVPISLLPPDVLKRLINMI